MAWSYLSLGSDAFKEHLRRAPALSLEQEALLCPPHRARRLYMMFAAARGFAPRACRVVMEHYNNCNDDSVATAHVPTQREYWRSVCEFVYLPEDGERCPAGLASVESARRFNAGLELERGGPQ